MFLLWYQILIQMVVAQLNKSSFPTFFLTLVYYAKKVEIKIFFIQISWNYFIIYFNYHFDHYCWFPLPTIKNRIEILIESRQSIVVFRGNDRLVIDDIRQRWSRFVAWMELREVLPRALVDESGGEFENGCSQEQLGLSGKAEDWRHE